MVSPGGRAGHAGRVGQPERRHAGTGRREQRVHVPVVAPGELDHQRAAGEPAGQPHRGHRRLGARIDQADLLHRGPRDDLLGQVHLARRGRAERGTVAPAPRTTARAPPGARARGSSAPRSRPGRRTRARPRRSGRARDPRTMNLGTPPTAPNARTGEFTPPGVTSRARANSDSLRIGPPESAEAGTLRPRRRRRGTPAAAARPAAGAPAAGAASARPGLGRNATAGPARSCPGSASAGLPSTLSGSQSSPHDHHSSSSAGEPLVTTKNSIRSCAEHGHRADRAPRPPPSARARPTLPRPARRAHQKPGR